MSDQIQSYGVTHVGNVREINEDQFLIASLSRSMQVRQTSLLLDDKACLFGDKQGLLLMVADGMGGHAAGERASAIVVDSFAMFLLNSVHAEGSGEAQSLERLTAAVQHCRERLEVEIEAVPQAKGMGTTLTMAYITWPRVYILHVGDSRCYLHQNGCLRQVTTDHTMAQYMVETGAISADEAQGSPWSHRLWNVIGGGDENPHVELHSARLRRGDALLLCTDGLSNYVTTDDILDLLDSERSPETICETLLKTALEAGGNDNITAVVARFDEMEDIVEDERGETTEELNVSTDKTPAASTAEPTTDSAGSLADTVDFPKTPDQDE